MIIDSWFCVCMCVFFRGGGAGGGSCERKVQGCAERDVPPPVLQRQQLQPGLPRRGLQERRQLPRDSPPVHMQTVLLEHARMHACSTWYVRTFMSVTRAV
ncbi:defensin-like protein [Iris pallida]|uniref:Defensin-like protein n=1 Tax=Iris pallida TaxID=29817 RepID=A0AAX6EDJ9_IRIPA|nr:defensin-like protein [Iris pallida]